MGFPALDGSYERFDTAAHVLRKGQIVHFIASETEQHQLAFITDIVNEREGSVILQVNDDTRPQGRYTTGPVAHDEQLSVGSWHWQEQ